ncbi:LANO_0C01794g1_1 [Lachancea nothofagi CBS 11611]|uniref:LANO_0C01794g1_1 n=1 Tax=Lachancea nothofagi CBS 11611 TaxID=1266666 RepID=A0A1G4J4J0_9SACH|nr:LANO_0C01794g1_1 [Lachancea nothofagi CBS 11611]
MNVEEDLDSRSKKRLIKDFDATNEGEPVGPSPLEGRKRLACSNCRRRRKKCDLDYPCGNCVRLKLDCNVNMEDMRKKRHTANYVGTLESHVASLETRLKKLAEKLSSLNGIRVEDMDLGVNSSIDDDHRSSSMGHYSNVTISSENMIAPSTMTFGAPELSVNDSLRKKGFVKGSIYPEGPASYKPKKPEHSIPKPKQRIADLKTTVIVRNKKEGGEALNANKEILKSLSNFYVWLYPGHFVFVHRESFLYGFFDHDEDNYENSQYCSEELIYAVAAIGARLTPDMRGLSNNYYQKAKEKLLKIVFDEQSIAKITTVQALLCLAFYELGNGNNQLAWYFSGLAIRVGHDMGFQLDPRVWVTDESTSNELSQSELEIRSRIYWGCYIADHFICLLLGRTSTLSVSNSTIPESDELPEVNGTEEFRFKSKHVLQVSLPLKNLVILSRIVQVFTAKIFIEPSTTAQRIEYLVKFNLRVYQWRQSLPDFLKWSKSVIKNRDSATDPTISYFWYHYYIVLLTFNKPFMEDSKKSKILVLEVLGELKTLFSNFQTRFGNFEKASIYQLYSCLLSVACSRKLTTMPPETGSGQLLEPRINELNFYTEVFQNFSLSYDLPRRLRDEPASEVDNDSTSINQLNNLAYTHDFSLSDEIDLLIKQVFGFESWSFNPSHSV